MNLDDLMHTGGEWLRGTGPESDIVQSSRIRLARNLATYPFINRANRTERADIERDFRAAMVEADLPLSYFDVQSMSPLDRQFLVERQLLSREHANAEGPRGVAIGP